MLAFVHMRVKVLCKLSCVGCVAPRAATCAISGAHLALVTLRSCRLPQRQHMVSLSEVELHDTVEAALLHCFREYRFSQGQASLRVGTNSGLRESKRGEGHAETVMV